MVKSEQARWKEGKSEKEKERSVTSPNDGDVAMAMKADSVSVD